MMHCLRHNRLPHPRSPSPASGRGVQSVRYARFILIAEIARATFGVTPGAHSRLKKLKQVKTGNNLRDHMTDLELIFTMLGEASTTEIAKRKNAQGFKQNRTVAKEGGTIAGDARNALEAKIGRAVVSGENFLGLASTNEDRKPEPNTGKAGTAIHKKAAKTENPKVRKT